MSAARAERDSFRIFAVLIKLRSLADTRTMRLCDPDLETSTGEGAKNDWENVHDVWLLRLTAFVGVIYLLCGFIITKKKCFHFRVFLFRNTGNIDEFSVECNRADTGSHFVRAIP